MGQKAVKQIRLRRINAEFAMNDRIYFRPLIPLLMSLMVGILLGSRIPGFTIGIGLLTAIWGGVCLLGIFRGRPSRFLPILLFVFLGYLSIQPWLSPRIPAHHIKHYTGTQRWEILGQIASPPRQIKHRTRFEVQVASLGADRHTRAVTGLLRLTVAGEGPEYSIGDKIQFKSRMRSITNFKNPGGFDYQRYLAFKGIYATAYVSSERLRILENSQPGVIDQLLKRVRGKFAGLVEKTGSPEVQGVLKALVIGDRTGISETIRQVFNRAGVAHLLAISGLHIGIVATVAFGFFHWLMGWVTPLLWRAWTRKAAALLSLLPVIGYGVIAGLSPSTQRAVLMVSVFLLTFLLTREQDSTNTLALAALVILVVDPPALFSVSFQLSFVTVFTIIYGFVALRGLGFLQTGPDTGGWSRRLALGLVTFFLVSLLAIGGSLPLAAFYFNQISLVGLVANFLVVPLIGFITVPLGLAGLFISLLSTTLATWLLGAAAVVLAGALDIVRFFSELPFAAIKTVTPGLPEIVCYYLLGWAVLDMLRARVDAGHDPQSGGTALRNRNDGPAEDPPPMKKLKSVEIFGYSIRSGVRWLAFTKLSRIIAAAALLALAVDVGYWLYQRYWHPDLRVTVIDVGDGNAALLEIPGGTTIMVDGGGFSDNTAFDVGARIIAPFLWQKKIKTIDLLILSHPNSDHLNGLIFLADHFNVKALWTNDEPRDTAGFHQLMDMCSRRMIFLPEYSHLARDHLFSGVRLDVLYPPRDFMDLKEAEKWRTVNNNSLVLKVSYGDISFLFPGDIMAAAEKELVGLADGRLASTVLIAPHHGSRSSSSQLFIEEVNPEVVVVSCARSSRFMFPHPEVIQRYTQMGIAVYRTDLDGAVRLATNGQVVEVRPFRRASDKL